MTEADVVVGLLSVTSGSRSRATKNTGCSSAGAELGGSSVDMKEDCDEEQAVVQKGEDGDQGSTTFAILLRPSCAFVSLMLLAFACRWLRQKCTASQKYITSPH